MMESIFEAMQTMPTGIYTIGMMFMALYWAFVAIGFLDIDLIPFDAPDIDAPDVEVEIGHDADVGHDVHVGHGGIFNLLVGTLGVGTVPLTVILSVLVSSGWCLGIVTEVLIWPHVQGFTPTAVFATAQALLMFFLGIQVTAICMKPLKKKLKVEQIHGEAHLIGKTVTITSGSVTEKLGTASLREDSIDLVLNVRIDEENEIKKGDHVVVVDYDKEQNTYKIKPININSEGV